MTISDVQACRQTAAKMQTSAQAAGGVSIAEAARQLGRSNATIRRWVARGAPCVSPGESGRGKGAVVKVADLQRWKAAGNAPDVTHTEWLSRLAEAMMAFHRTQDYRVIGLAEWQHAGYLCGLYSYIAHRVGSDLEPSDIKLLSFIYEQDKPKPRTG